MSLYFNENLFLYKHIFTKTENVFKTLVKKYILISVGDLLLKIYTLLIL